MIGSVAARGVAAVTLAVTVAVAAGGVAYGATRTYRVAPGDTVTSIATRFGVSSSALVAANHLDNPDHIVIGAALIIPGRGGGSGSSGGAAHTAPNPTGPLAPVHAPRPGPPRFPARLAAHPSRLALRPAMIRWSRAFGVPTGLLEAMTWMESGWQSGVVSSTGAVGIGQLEPSTVRFASRTLLGLSKPLDPTVPTANIEMSAAYLAYMIRSAHGSVANALGGYYQGLDSVYASGPFPSTRAYVRIIGDLWQQFRSG